MRPLLLLRLFDHDLFADVANAFALVRLRRTDRADFGRDLSDHLSIGPLDDDLGLRRALDLDSRRHVLGHRMREADLQVELAAGGCRAVADTYQGQLLLETLAD